MTAGADPETQRRSWALVAEAAAMHRRFMAGEDISYGDPDLRRSGQTVARRSLLSAVQRALGAGVDREEIVDAICSGDPSLDVGEAHGYVEAAPKLRSGLEEFKARMLRDIFGERD